MTIENLYKDRDPRNHISDGEARALYWIDYRETYERLLERLEPGKIIPLSESICFMANNCLRPQDFDLRRKKDFSTIGLVESPGVSAHILFSTNPYIICGAIMDRDLKRQDAIYIASAREIAGVSWAPIYAPTPNQPLHVRLVPSKLIGSEPQQAPIELRKALSAVFDKNKLRGNCK